MSIGDTKGNGPTSKINRFHLAIAAIVLTAAIGGYAFFEFKKFQHDNLAALPLVQASFTESPIDRKDWLDVRAQQNMAEFALGMLWATGLSLSVGVVTLFFLGWTLRETRSMARDSRRMVEETGKMARDSEKMLEQSKKDAEDARRVTQSQHRAYLRATEAQLVPAEGGTGWDVKITYRNDGETPAMYVHHRAHLVVRDVNYPREPDLVIGPPGSYRTIRPIPPRGDDEPRYYFPDFEVAARSAENTDKRVASVKGEVLYQDTFGIWVKSEFEFYLRRDQSWLYHEARKTAVPLKWGKRGAGGVYEVLAEESVPEYVRTLKDARED